MPYSAKMAATSYIQRDQQTLVALYNITNARPQLVKAYTFDGSLQDSRIVNNKLVLISTQSMYRGPIYRVMEDTSTQSSSPSDFKVKAQDVLPTWTVLTPTTTK
jgi:hypothetical protein